MEGILIKQIESSDEKRMIMKALDYVFPRGIFQRDNCSEIVARIDRYALFFAAVNCDNEEDYLGYIAFYANDSISKVGYVSQLGVGALYQNKYIGTLLMRKAFEVAIKLGMTKMRLEVLTNNHNGIRFHEKMGFTYEKNGNEGTIYMIKTLTE